MSGRQLRGRWVEMPGVWVARRFERSRKRALACWSNQRDDGAIDGIVVLYEDGTAESLLNAPLRADRMRDVMQLACDRFEAELGNGDRASGTRVKSHGSQRDEEEDTGSTG